MTIISRYQREITHEVVYPLYEMLQIKVHDDTDLTDGYYDIEEKNSIYGNNVNMTGLNIKGKVYSLSKYKIIKIEGRLDVSTLSTSDGQAEVDYIINSSVFDELSNGFNILIYRPEGSGRRFGFCGFGDYESIAIDEALPTNDYYKVDYIITIDKQLYKINYNVNVSDGTNVINYSNEVEYTPTISERVLWSEFGLIKSGDSARVKNEKITLYL